MKCTACEVALLIAWTNIVMKQLATQQREAPQYKSMRQKKLASAADCLDACDALVSFIVAGWPFVLYNNIVYCLSLSTAGGGLYSREY